MSADACARALLAVLALPGASCAPEPASRTAPEFLARLEFPTARSGLAKPVHLLAGDLDADGRDELVAATRSPGGIEIWSGLSPLLGPAPEPRSFPFGDFPLGPVWLGGARPLAAIASRETLELAVVDLAAAVRSKDRADLPVAWRARLPARPRAIASGDLGRDGKPEVAVITVEDELLLYTGPAEPRRFQLEREHPVCALLASDGERIAIGYQGSRRVAILRADGSTEISAELPGLPRAFDEADFDGDGDTELAAASGEDRLVVFGLSRPGGPAGWLDAKPLEVQVGTVPVALAHAREELAVLDLHAQDVRVLGFAEGSPVPLATRAAGQRPLDLAVGDFDGDGAPDLAVANADARRVGLLFARGGKSRAGTIFASESRIRCDRAPTSIAPGDLDGDGHTDLAVLAAADETLSWFRNDGGVLFPVTAVPAPASSAVACAVLGGRARVACLQRGGDGSSILVAPAIRLPLPDLPGAGDLLFVDLAGDGRTCSVVADPERDRVGVAEIEVDRTEGGLRLGAMRVVESGSGPRALALLRREPGAALVAVADGGPGDARGITILRLARDADGRIQIEKSQQLAMRQHPIAIAAKDLDGDRREDLAVLATASGGDSQGFVVPWIAGPDGSFTPLEPMATGNRAHRVAAGDLDGDGRAEILVTAQGSHHVEVWLAREGDPVRFVRAPDLGAGTGPLDLALVDLDGDGSQEIVVANGFSDDISIVRCSK